jgi:hypothetical protein
VVGTITSDGTEVIETSSSEAGLAAVVPGRVVELVVDGGTDDGATVSTAVVVDAIDAGAVAGCGELQPATRTAATNTRGLTRHRPFEQGTAGAYCS